MSNADLFHDMLKSRRKAMGAGNRKKTKHPKMSSSWLYPYAKERKYFKGISKIQRELTTPTTKIIAENLQGWIADYHQDGVDTFKRDSFSSELKEVMAELQEALNEIYGDNAPKIRALITGIGDDVSEFNYKQFQKYAKQLLGVEFIVTEPWETEVIDAWVETNYNLVNSLSGEYLKSVNTIVAEGVQFGKTYDEIMREIRKKNKQMTGSRARLIARDQVGKLNGALTKRRMEDAGISMYTWLTAGDERVRGNPSGPFKNAVPSHYIMSGVLCRWDDNTVYSADNGKTWIPRIGKMPIAIPGQEIQCRCTALPYFDDMIDDIDEEIDQEEAA